MTLDELKEILVKTIAECNAPIEERLAASEARAVKWEDDARALNARLNDERRREHERDRQAARDRHRMGMAIELLADSRSWETVVAYGPGASTEMLDQQLRPTVRLTLHVADLVIEEASGADGVPDLLRAFPDGVKR